MPVGEPLGVEVAVREALDSGAEIVFVGGGDGTIRAAASALAGAAAVLALLPLGTGNVLARNLGVPLDLEAAIAVAASGARRRIDLGNLGGQLFTVAAGLGMDAELLAATGAAAKRRVGPSAYVLSGLRRLGSPPFQVRVQVDGGEPFDRRVAAAVVCNVPRLPFGVSLDPQGSLDDGLLDLVLIEPDGLAGWPLVAMRLLGTRAGRGVERFRGRHIRVVAEGSHAREVDGDPIAAGVELDAWAIPLALSVCAPG